MDKPYCRRPLASLSHRRLVNPLQSYSSTFPLKIREAAPLRRLTFGNVVSTQAQRARGEITRALKRRFPSAQASLAVAAAALRTAGELFERLPSVGISDRANGRVRGDLEPGRHDVSCHASPIEFAERQNSHGEGTREGRSLASFVGINSQDPLPVGLPEATGWLFCRARAFGGRSGRPFPGLPKGRRAVNRPAVSDVLLSGVKRT